MNKKMDPVQAVATYLEKEAEAEQAVSLQLERLKAVQEQLRETRHQLMEARAKAAEVRDRAAREYKLDRMREVGWRNHMNGWMSAYQLNALSVAEVVQDLHGRELAPPDTDVYRAEYLMHAHEGDLARLTDAPDDRAARDRLLHGANTLLRTAHWLVRWVQELSPEAGTDEGLLLAAHVDNLAWALLDPPACADRDE